MLNITVITVCFNEKRKIRETMESVLCQTYPHIEYLVMDGASTDGTVDILREYESRGHIRMYSEPDAGVYNAMNRGVARASGDYVFFLNAGDLFFHERVVADMVSHMDGDTAAIYYGKSCMVQADGLKQIVDFSQQEGTLEEKLLVGGMPCHQSIFAPRKLLEEHPFREEYQIRADYEWLLYAVGRGSRCVGVPVTVCFYDAAGISGRIRNYRRWQRESEEIAGLHRNRFPGAAAAEDGRAQTDKWKYWCRKNRFMFQLMSYWMALKQRGVDLAVYLQKKGYGRIAIYGMGNLGHTLSMELKGSSVSVAYVIDQHAENLCAEYPVYRPTEALQPVDLIIVTTVMCFEEVRDMLSEKKACPVVSLEDLLYEAGEWADGGGTEAGYENRAVWRR
ncbi:MAG TPA: hypothetical protein DF613_14750 [Lachnospiraceae bacterium]|nr:hypothetical protein [Lachnospiraceae bacterium]